MLMHFELMFHIKFGIKFDYGNKISKNEKGHRTALVPSLL